MSDDRDTEDSRSQWPLRAEQYDAANQALDIFYSYLLEEGDGPGTRQLLDDTLGGEESVTRDRADKLAAGLLAVAAALSAPWRIDGQMTARTPQQIVEFLRKMFTPYE
jgi:hypothetical protein